MTPIECYWPPEMLAQVFPERYAHLIPVQPSKKTMSPSRYNVQRLPGGCVLIGLPGGRATLRATLDPAQRPELG
jgi:hypothetical protein